MGAQTLPLGLLEMSAGDRLVSSLKGMNLDLLSQAMMGKIVFSNDEQSASIFVNAVDDTGTDDPSNSRQAITTVIEQRVDKGPARISRRRMHHHTLWLINHQEIAVLINDIQRDILWLGRVGLRGRKVNEHFVPRAN